jgi:hypothetical protein
LEDRIGASSPGSRSVLSHEIGTLATANATTTSAARP